MKKYIYILILFLSITQYDSFSQTNKYVVSRELNFRSFPEDQDDNILLRLSNGDKVEFISFAGEWSKVQKEDLIGFVFSKFLSDSTILDTTTNNNLDSLVLICNSNTSNAYHSGYCMGLNKCTHSVSQIRLSEAKELGRTACNYCY